MLTLEEWDRPILTGKRVITFAIDPSTMDEWTCRKYANYLSPDLRKRLQQRESIDLEEFLRLGEGGRIHVFVFATDALSGARSISTTP